MRTLASTIFVVTALALVTAAGGCGSGGPGTYLVSVLESGDERVAASTLLPRPGR